MTYEEYKKAFEEILEISEKIERLYKLNKIDDVEGLFKRREELFAALSLPEEDLNEEQVAYIFKLRDKIQEKNQTLIRVMQVKKNEIKKELISLNQETKVVEKYKIPKGDVKSSIFDFRE